MAGTFVALDLILFFVFFEVVLLPMYFMIGIWGDRNEVTLPVFRRVTEMRLYAAIKFFLFTFFGSALMLLGFLVLYFRSGDGGEERTFDIVELTARSGLFTGTFAFWVFAALFLGFAVKVPMFPLHTWLPDAHTAAPTVGSVLLAAILLKLGTYGFVRISLPILPAEAQDWAPLIGILAVIGIIYASLACLAQTDMKRLIAFSSVGHMGFVMLGIATLTDIGINAAIIGMVAHGVITGLLFFLAGSMSHRYHTREMARLGGNQKLMPIMGAILGFTVHGLARPARARRVLGRVHVAARLVQPAGRAEHVAVPHADGGRRHRHRARRRLLPVDAAEGQFRRAGRRVGRLTTSTTSTAGRWRRGSRWSSPSSPSGCSPTSCSAPPTMPWPTMVQSVFGG